MNNLKIIMKKLAYFDTSHDMPEEIIMAAGFTPFKILGDVNVSNDPADQYLSNFFCPAARSWLTDALVNSGNWDGIIFAHGCDVTNRHFDIWKKHVETPYLYWFNFPMNINNTAQKFFKKEVNLLIKSLENQFKISIGQDNIQSAIKKSNSIKIKMRQLSKLRAEKNIPNRDYFDISIKCVQMEKDELLMELDLIIKEWTSRPEFPADKYPVLLTGSDVTYAAWMDIMEEAGMRAVRDDLSIGERYYFTLIPENIDPIDALAEYYFNIPRPATRNPPDDRLAHLLNILGEKSARGVVSQNLKFCEPYAYDAVFILNEIKNRGYKTIHLEREFTPIMDHQLITRLEAFKEIL